MLTGCLFMFRNVSGGESLDRELRSDGVAHEGDAQQRSAPFTVGGGHRGGA